MLYKISTTARKHETEESVKELLSDLSSNSAEITVLDLSSNTFSPEVFRLVAKQIKELPGLVEIRLESFLDSLTFEEMLEVMAELGKSLPRTLSVFEMPSNALSCDFPEEFESFLAECPLRVLNLFNCGLGEDGLIRVANALNSLPNKENLQVLNLSRNRINKLPDNFAAIFNSFPNISDFRIRNNTIECESMGLFLEQIDGSKLTVLDLSDNFLRGSCPSALGKLFCRADLSELYLFDGKMDEEGPEILFKAACEKQSTALPGGLNADRPGLVLDVSYLGMEKNAVEPLIKLAKKWSIKRLIIFGNDCEDLDELVKVVEKSGGVVVEEEESSEASEEADEALVDRLKAMNY